MSTFSNLSSNAEKESSAKRHIVKYGDSELCWVKATCSQNSNSEKFITVEPKPCWKSFEKYPINHAPIIIPNEKSIEDFVYKEISSYLKERAGTLEIEIISEKLRNLSINIAINNINFLSNLYKSNDPEPEKEQRKNVENH